MRRLFTKISSAALLFCLASHNSFSMPPEEEDSGKHPSRETSLPLAQSSSQEGQELEHFNVGGSQHMRETSFPMEIAPRYNFKYATFREAYFDLIDKKFPQFLKVVQGLKGKVPLEKFLSLCDGYLEKMTLPFILFLEDSSKIITMLPQEIQIEEGLSISVPAKLTAHLPRTREENLQKQDKLASTVSLVQGKSDHLPPMDPALGHVAIPDLIRLSFNFCETKVALLESKRAALSENREEKESLLREAVDVYIKYLLYIDSFEKMIKLPQNHLTFLAHKVKVLNKIPLALDNLALFYLSQDKKDAYIKALSAKETYMSLQLNVMYEYQKISTDKEIENSQSFLLRNLFNLSIMEYGFYFQSNLPKAQEAYRRAENYNHKIKALRDVFKDIYRENQARLEELKIRSCAASGRGKQVHQEQEIERITRALVRFEAKITEMTFYPEHRKFMASLEEISKSLSRSPAEIEKVQNDISFYENKLLEREEVSSLVPSEIDEFYQKYKTALLENVDELVHTNNMLVNFFIISGQFERGMNHVRSFKKVYEEPDQRRLEIKSSILKAFQGDPEDFLAFVETCRSEQAQKIEQKKKRKEEKEKAYASVVRAAQEKSAHSKNLKELRTSQPSFERRKNPSLSPDFEASSYKTLLAASEIAPSTEEEKEEKRKRHHEKLEERRKELEQEKIRVQEAAAAEGVEEARGGDLQAEADVREDVWFPFVGKRINLTTAQERVDRQIKEKSWNFTKLDLERYYEEFGCTVSQSGPHTKAALPAYKDVRLPDGTPLSVIFEERDAAYEGGSFTLPNWQDQVPFYLRKQILKARQKIQAYFDLLDKAVLRQFETGEKTI